VENIQHNTGYESPITIITGQMKYEIENEIYRAVQEVGVSVDKEELIKALLYDREQYVKGYTDGIKDFVYRLKERVKNQSSMDFEDVDEEVKEMIGDSDDC
jgi:hypothetical protein